MYGRQHWESLPKQSSADRTRTEQLYPSGCTRSSDCTNPSQFQAIQKNQVNSQTFPGRFQSFFSDLTKSKFTCKPVSKTKCQSQGQSDRAQTITQAHKWTVDKQDSKQSGLSGSWSVSSRFLHIYHRQLRLGTLNLFRNICGLEKIGALLSFYTLRASG